VRESKERYTRYIQESLEMRELQSQLDDLDSSIKALEVFPTISSNLVRLNIMLSQLRKRG
jgi:hypothetical protein